jgi:hypothetical protein
MNAPRTWILRKEKGHRFYPVALDFRGELRISELELLHQSGISAFEIENQLPLRIATST